MKSGLLLLLHQEKKKSQDFHFELLSPSTYNALHSPFFFFLSKIEYFKMVISPLFFHMFNFYLNICT